MGLIRTADLAVLLQTSDLIYESWIRPGFGPASHLLRGNYVGGRFFNNAEALQFQLANDCSLARSRRTGDDEPLHLFSDPRVSGFDPSTSNRAGLWRTKRIICGAGSCGVCLVAFPIAVRWFSAHLICPGLS